MRGVIKSTPWHRPARQRSPECLEECSEWNCPWCYWCFGSKFSLWISKKISLRQNGLSQTGLSQNSYGTGNDGRLTSEVFVGSSCPVTFAQSKMTFRWCKVRWNWLVELIFWYLWTQTCTCGSPKVSPKCSKLSSPKNWRNMRLLYNFTWSCVPHWTDIPQILLGSSNEIKSQTRHPREPEFLHALVSNAGCLTLDIAQWF